MTNCLVTHHSSHTYKNSKPYYPAINGVEEEEEICINCTPLCANTWDYLETSGGNMARACVSDVWMEMEIILWCRFNNI